MRLDPSPANTLELIERLSARVRKRDGQSDLNPAQWSALRYLSQANRMSRTPGAFAGYHGTTKGTASQTIRCLQERGLVTATQDQDDRRHTRLDLSPRGRELLEADPARVLEQAISALPESRRQQLYGELRHLSDVVQTADCGAGAASFGRCAECGRLVGDETSGWQCDLNREALGANEMTQLCAWFVPNAERLNRTR